LKYILYEDISFSFSFGILEWNSGTGNYCKLILEIEEQSERWRPNSDGYFSKFMLGPDLNIYLDQVADD